MVSSRDIKQRGPTKIDPRFPIPGGLIDAEYKQDNNQIPVEFGPDAGGSTDASGVQVVDIGGNVPPDAQQTTYAYQPPTNIAIVSQTVRILPDGSHLVDVLIDVTDVAGISEYEVRTTKTS